MASINNEQIITTLKMWSTPFKNLYISLAIFICTSILPLYVKYVQKFETEDKPFESWGYCNATISQDGDTFWLPI